MTWTPGPWRWNYSKASTRYHIDVSPAEGIYIPVAKVEGADDARLIALAPEMATALEEVVGWLESSDAFEQNHGAHSAAVEARKLLARAKGGS